MSVMNKESIMYKMFCTIKAIKYLEVFHSPGRIKRVEIEQTEYLNCDVTGQPVRSDVVSKCRGKLQSKQKNIKKHKKNKKK